VKAVGIGRPSDAPTEGVCDGFEIVRSGVWRRRWFVRWLLVPIGFLLMARRSVRKWAPDRIIAGNWNSFLVACAVNGFSARGIIYYQLEYNDRKALRWRSPLMWVLMGIERRMAKGAARLFTAEPHRACLVKADYDLPYEPAVIRNAPLVSDCAARLQEFEPGQLRLVYVGSIGPKTCVPELLLVWTRVALPGRLELFGPVDEPFRDELSKLVDLCGRTGNSVRYRGTVPYREVPAILHNHEVGFAFYRGDNRNQLYAAPSKVFEYFAAGIAVIASSSPSLVNIVAVPGRGLCVDPSRPEEIVTAIRSLDSNRSSLREMRERAHDAFLSGLNFDTQAQPLIAEVERS
jgi:glycosyltransferase involved in cell wall biosynthesis